MVKPMRKGLLMTLLAALPSLAALRFRPQDIQRDFGVVYAVLAEDVNGDGKPDVVAINPTQVAWFENPTFTKHVILDGATKKDNVSIAATDVDRDGQLDFAVGADWQPTNTASGGSLQWIRGTRAPGPWPMTPLGEEPTLHRIRWGDVDGDGKPELIVVPLHGRGTKGPDWDGKGARILVFRVPANPRSDKWPVEVADESLHIVHNFIIVDGEIWTASREGVHALKRGPAGAWQKRKLGDGSPGEIKLGKVNRVRHLATVEPWHSNSIVVYEEPTQTPDPQSGPALKRIVLPGMWKRAVIETQLNAAHALGWGDFDSDGSDELAVGWRNKPAGVAVYKRTPAGAWTRTMVDDGGLAAEDIAVADLNGDGKPEIIGAGRATGNVRIYWNESEPAWKRHVVATGYRNQTAIAADFTGDGKVDVISNDIDQKKTWLYVAPEWKAVLLDASTNLIHSAVIDVDRDGKMDFIGTRYSPGLIFWLRQPRDAARDKWEYHLVDDVAQGGVDGIHGLITGDVDKDGVLDLIGNSALPKGTFPSSLAWFRIPPSPLTASRWERYIFADRDAPGLSHYLGFGDVNGDGRPDLASAAKIGEEGNWFAWWEQPAALRGPWRKHVVATNQPGATNILMADVNRDGKTDFIATRGHGRGVVWYEAPDWTAHEANTDLLGPHSLAVGDIDGDGDIDIATCAKDSFVAAWLENDGRGYFKTHHVHEDQAAYDIRLADMDGDGDLDILIAGQESRNVTWYENPKVAQK
jgi:hypothetical protein